MFKLNVTASTLDISLLQVIPGLVLVIHVAKPADDRPISVNVTINAEVRK